MIGTFSTTTNQARERMSMHTGPVSILRFAGMAMHSASFRSCTQEQARKFGCFGANRTPRSNYNSPKAGNTKSRQVKRSSGKTDFACGYVKHFDLQKNGSIYRECLRICPSFRRQNGIGSLQDDTPCRGRPEGDLFPSASLEANGLVRIKQSQLSFRSSERCGVTPDCLQRAKKIWLMPP